ncbi:hypothetical protein TspCOW1_09800 [Thiohalobacter sp. COW1]|uniref:hypothetical protein n=1 Tax=Thiohalobacter sp. COW1 TaxID=2795687 RepID=UPI001937AFD4|nr:hypothetical protein TspCOW1_09800 [Thiohalobacter sp. COW1]
MNMTTEASTEGQDFKNILDHTDEELQAIAHPMWEELIEYSNKGQYGKFIKKFSYNLLFGLNEVEVGKQFVKSALTRSLDPNYDFLGFIRRGEHVTCLYRVRSTKKEGEWLGRMVLGYEDGEVRIFGASIF